jgi:outer membrane protein assembly factor BamE (lipoprotein component of BamABCDE complex)
MMTTPIERTTRAALALLAALSLSACAPLFRQPPPAGAPLAEVTAALGQPNAVYPEPDGGRVLEYRGQPMGQFQYMARIGPDGRLVSYDQVLTSENFAKVKIGQWTRDDILRNFGQPAETSAVAFHDYEVWSYRYKEAGVWNSMMHVHFDQQGIVRQMLNGPDPRYDDRYRRF